MLRGGRRGRRCQSRRREPADGKGRAEPSRAEPGVTLRMSGTGRGLLPSSSPHPPRGCGLSRLGRGASAAAGPRSPSRRSRRGPGRSGCAAGAGTSGRLAGAGWDPLSPGPPNPQSSRRRSSISFAEKNGENGKPPAGRQVSPCPGRRESPLRRQHLHSPPGPGAAFPRPAGRAAPVPLPAQARVRCYSPPGTGPLERRGVPRTLPPHRRGARRRAPPGPARPWSQSRSRSRPRPRCQYLRAGGRTEVPGEMPRRGGRSRGARRWLPPRWGLHNPSDARRAGVSKRVIYSCPVCSLRGLILLLKYYLWMW